MTKKKHNKPTKGDNMKKKVVVVKKKPTGQKVPASHTKSLKKTINKPMPKRKKRPGSKKKKC